MRSAPTLTATLALITVGLAEAQEPLFIESARRLGVAHRHRSYATPSKYMPETMGSGLAVFDADGDGRLDLYFVQGAPIEGGEAEPNRLFLQNADGRFRDATESAGVGDTGVGMGAAVGDVDGDGDDDLYVTNFGPNVLYRNLGEGRFEDVTAEARVASPGWSVSAGFFDFDGDGDLDLYVVHYVDFAISNHRWCGDAQRDLRAYCHPDVYEAQDDRLFINDGTGRFAQAPLEAGVPHTRDGKGLGLSFGDLDGDGGEDAYVANDSTMNYLLLNEGGHFVESALVRGAGYNGAGQAEAGMGVAIGDVDGDGRQDILVTHLDHETHTLYLASQAGGFEDATERAGLAVPSRPMVGFGTAWLDCDHDGDLDLLVTNGHIIDNIEALGTGGSVYRQPSQLFENLGATRFEERPDALGLPTKLVGRGAVAADLDGDGDLDLVITQNDGPVMIAVNQLDAPKSALIVRLRGSPPRGLGARVELRVGDRRQVRQVTSATSYLSAAPPELHFGLGDAGQADELVVRWPNGEISRHGPLKGGFAYEVKQGSTDIDAQPFHHPLSPCRGEGCSPRLPPGEPWLLACREEEILCVLRASVAKKKGAS